MSFHAAGCYDKTSKFKIKSHRNGEKPNKGLPTEENTPKMDGQTTTIYSIGSGGDCFY